MGIGLKYGTVRVVPYQPDWADLFIQERDRLASALDRLAVDIQHVGSTSVPGLPAKPIIDIAICIDKPTDIDLVIPALSDIGYIYRGNAEETGGHLFVRESSPWVRTHHVHVVEKEDPQWLNYMRFRDALRADPLMRDEYAELKEQLRKKFADDRKGYTAAKHAFIRERLGLDPDSPARPLTID